MFELENPPTCFHIREREFLLQFEDRDVEFRLFGSVKIEWSKAMQNCVDSPFRNGKSIRIMILQEMEGRY